MASKRFFILVLAAASQVGATDNGGCGGGQVTRDPGFDLWCGDTMCAWKVLRGMVERAPTWHEKDAGVAFLGTDTAIAQLAPVTSVDGTCLQFSLLADLGERTEVVLDLDLNGDGSVEHSERFATGPWHPLVYTLNLRPPFAGIDFIIRKAGTGAATLAQIDADIVSATNCEAFSQIVAAPAQNGSPCEVEGDCASGLCVQIQTPTFGGAKTCVGCDPTGADTCDAGTVCGLAEPLSPVREIVRECVAEGADGIGALCRVDAECDSGLCTDGVCSSCKTFAQCATNETCARAYAQGPHVCNPALGNRTTGQPCALDADCASAECTGTDRYQCDDGRSCPTGDRTFCPTLSDMTLEPGECMLVGVEGGTCR